MDNLVSSIYCLLSTLVLANSATASEEDKSCFLTSPLIPTDIQNFFCDKPVFVWLVAISTIISMAVAAVAVLTGNLQKIIDFFKNNFTRKIVEVDDAKLLKYRKQLLDRLESDILIRQKNSLHELVQIDLAKEERRRQVGGSAYNLVPPDETKENKNILNRFSRIFSTQDSQESKLNPEQKIIDFYDLDDIKGKLLILGDPGAGKTTELISLAKDLINRAKEDETAPIPIIFELSSWKEDLPIEDWLIEQLPQKYPGLPKAVAKKWLNNQQLIPLLDGLDELGLELEDRCIVAINQFMHSRFQPALVVCCRLEEYEQAQNRLNCLNGAIYLRPLSDRQIQHYLKRLNRASIWDKTIANQTSILALVSKPLFLTMIVVAYQDRAIRNESELFEAYIQKQLNNPDNQGTYAPNKSPSKKQTLHYLAWLARKLEAERETEFLIEEMQPSWLESPQQKIVCGLFFGLIGGLIFGLSFGHKGLIFGLIGGLIGGSMYGQEYIKPVEKLKFSINNVKNWLILGLILGLSFGLIVGLIAELSFGLSFGVFFGLFYGISFGASFGLITGMFYGISFGASFGLIYGLFYGLIVGLFYDLLTGCFMDCFSD